MVIAMQWFGFFVFQILFLSSVAQAGKFNCTECHNDFATQIALRAHKCPGDEAARCPDCQVIFSSRSNMNQHHEKRKCSSADIDACSQYCLRKKVDIAPKSRYEEGDMHLTFAAMNLDASNRHVVLSSPPKLGRAVNGFLSGCNVDIAWCSESIRNLKLPDSPLVCIQDNFPGTRDYFALAWNSQRFELKPESKLVASHFRHVTCYLQEREGVAPKTIAVVGVHLSLKKPLNERLKEYVSLIERFEELELEEVDYVIDGGDWNADPDCIEKAGFKPLYNREDGPTTKAGSYCDNARQVYGVASKAIYEMELDHFPIVQEYKWPDAHARSEESQSQRPSKPGRGLSPVRSSSINSKDSHLSAANRESILSITQATIRGIRSTVVTSTWTDSDGDCAFHALDRAYQPGTVTRQTFLAQVAVVMADEANPLHTQFIGLFADLAAAGQFANYEAWLTAMQPQPGVAPLWTGDFELNLWGLLNGQEILVFTLGDNAFIHHGAGNTFGLQGAPPIWIAHVNADGPVVAAIAHRANHYIALQQPTQLTSDEDEEDSKKRVENKLSDTAADLIKMFRRGPPPPPPGGGGVGGAALSSSLTTAAAAGRRSVPAASSSSAGKSNTAGSTGKKAALSEKGLFTGAARILTGFARAVSVF